MKHKLNNDGKLLNDSERISKSGYLIRKFGLDEITQLYLILIGKMSFVGPRPLLIKYLAHYPKDVRKRHNVKPGITGLAQINGRNEQTWEKRFEYDLKYVRDINFFLDFKILIQTFFIKKNGHIEMKPYV